MTSTAIDDCGTGTEEPAAHVFKNDEKVCTCGTWLRTAMIDLPPRTITVGAMLVEAQGFVPTNACDVYDLSDGYKECLLPVHDDSTAHVFGFRFSVDTAEDSAPGQAVTHTQGHTLNTYDDVEMVGDRVLIRPIQEAASTAGGIVKRQDQADTPVEGIVLAVSYRENQFVVGDRVIYGRYNGTNITLDGEQVKVLRHDEIVAKRRMKPAAPTLVGAAADGANHEEQ